MLFVILFLLNAGLSFALSLTVAALIGPESFGHYALALSIAIVIATVAFEWLRLSATRFFGDAVRGTGVRATLDLAYVVLSLLIVGGGWVAWSAGGGAWLGPSLLAAAIAAGLALGWFDYALALARARFLDGAVAMLLSTRAIGSFVLAVALAIACADPALILGGTALAAAFAVGLVRLRLAEGGKARERPDAALLFRFARYAVPIVVAGALYQAMPLLNRALLASRAGFDAAGHFSLVGEIATRLFQNLGAALDLALFQLAVRAEAAQGRDAAERQAIQNLAIVAAIVAPAATGLCLVWPSFESLLAPAAFQGELAASARLLVPALAAYAVVLYGLGPLFQLRQATAAVTSAALVGLAIDLSLVLAWPGAIAAEHVAAAQLAGMAASLAVLTIFAVRSGFRLPWRDLGGTLVGCVVMAAALWPTLAFGAGPLTLALQVALGVGMYGAATLAFDIAGARSRLRRLVR